MFRLKPNHAPFPPLYEHVERKLATVKSKGYDKVGDFLLRDNIDLMPQEGLQENLARCMSNLIFICGEATSGKAQPYDAHILTPTGFVRMGDIGVGDTISGFDGQPQSVIKIFEQGEKDVFRVTFDDGAYTECCDEHLWQVRVKYSHNPYRQPKVMQFSEIRRLFDEGRKIAIPICAPQDFGGVGEIPIDPYVLGVMLGDGHIRRYEAFISTADQEIIDALHDAGYKTRKTTGKYDYRVSGNCLVRHLRELGLSGKLSHEKFIPQVYKLAGANSRLSLLQGLIDTDGTVDKSGHLAFYTVSRQLAIDTQFIVRSLGGRCSITIKHPYNRKDGVLKRGRDCYVLNINTDHNKSLCRLNRKKQRLFDGFRKGHAELRRFITKYEYVGKKKCRCILVSNKDSLYITDDFIVTHNTFGMMLKALQGVGVYGYTARLINVRKLDSAKGTSMQRDGQTVWGNFSNCEVTTGELPTFSWPKWNNAIQFLHANFNADNPSEWIDFQETYKKQQSALFLCDEATAIEQYKMFTYIFSRNRDASGITPQTILAFNPRYEHWTTAFLLNAGYIGDDWHLKPEMDGYTRYFYVKGDEPEDVVWGDSKAEVVGAAGIRLNKEDRAAGLTEEDMVKSFTLFTGHASGNRKLVNATGGQSVANLHNVGATQRAILAEAYFGPATSAKSSVTKQMVRDLATNPINDDENMYATLDISAGRSKDDNAPLIIWRGLRIVAIEIIQHKGDMKYLIEIIEGILQKYGVPTSNFAFDSTGIGYYMGSFINANPITANKTAIQEIDENGNPVTFEKYFNVRSQLLGKTKVLFETGQLSTSLDLSTRIPYGKKGETRRIDDILYDEIELFVSTTRNTRIYYLSKDEFKARHQGNSPDLMDTICLRAFFELDARPKKQPATEIEDDAYDGLFTDYASGRAGGGFWI